MRSGFWILDGENLVETDLMGWGEWFQNFDNRRVAETTIGDAWISTVFLGIDHNFSGDGPPLLFETMVFFDREDLRDEIMMRYATYAEAREGHDTLVAMMSMTQRESVDTMRAAIRAMRKAVKATK